MRPRPVGSDTAHDLSGPPGCATRECRPLTPAEAQRLQDRARERGRWITWFVAAAEGRAVAWAIVADRHGGSRLPGVLTAATLDELRAMLPPGLTQRQVTELMPPEVVEVWD